METKTYNGWRNYETWLCKLWMDNDQGSYSYWQDQTEECCESAEDADEAAAELASRIESTMDESMDDLFPKSSGFFHDLLMSSLQEIDYREIADSFVEDSGHEFDADDE